MRIPLHLVDTPDNQRENALLRVEHFVAAQQLNPKGFRTQGKNSQPTRIERIAEDAFGDDDGS